MKNGNILTPTLNLEELAERGIDPNAVRFLIHLLRHKGSKHGSLLMKDRGSCHGSFSGSFNYFAEEMLNAVRNRKNGIDSIERKEGLSLDGTPFAVKVETSRGPVTLRLQQLWLQKPHWHGEGCFDIAQEEIVRFVNTSVARQTQLRPVTREEFEAFLLDQAKKRSRGDPPHYVHALYLTTGTSRLYGRIGSDRKVSIGDVRESCLARWKDSETRQHESDSHGTSFSTEELWVVGK